jgi:hypothetical protein
VSHEEILWLGFDKFFNLVFLAWHFGVSHSNGAVFSVVYTVMQFRDFVSFQLFEQRVDFV